MIAMIVMLETVEEYEQRAKSADPYSEEFIIRCREYARKYDGFNSAYGALVLQDLGRALPVQYHSRVFEGITSFRFCEHVEQPEY